MKYLAIKRQTVISPLKFEGAGLTSIATNSWSDDDIVCRDIGRGKPRLVQKDLVWLEVQKK